MSIILSTLQATESAQLSRGETRWLIGGIAVLAIIWLVVRRKLFKSRGHVPPFGRTSKRETDRDFEWLAERGEEP